MLTFAIKYKGTKRKKKPDHPFIEISKWKKMASDQGFMNHVDLNQQRLPTCDVCSQILLQQQGATTCTYCNQLLVYLAGEYPIIELDELEYVYVVLKARKVINKTTT